MGYRYRFFVLERGAFPLVRVSQRRFIAAWDGKERLRDELRGTMPLGVVTVIVDDHLNEIVTYRTRLRIRGGFICHESKVDAQLVWHNEVGRPRIAWPTVPLTSGETRETRFQSKGWPSKSDLKRELAIALDAPVDRLHPCLFGGPLEYAVYTGRSLSATLAWCERRRAFDRIWKR